MNEWISTLSPSTAWHYITHWLKLKLVNFRILSADSRGVSWFPLIVAVNFSYFRYFWEKNSPERRLRTFSATRIPTGIFPFYSGPGATNSGRKMTFFNVRSLEKAEMARYQKRFLDILIKPPCLPKIPEIHRHLDTAKRNLKSLLLFKKQRRKLSRLSWKTLF